MEPQLVLIQAGDLDLYDDAVGGFIHIDARLPARRMEGHGEVAALKIGALQRS
jgi:hypothetical protein